MIAHTDHGTKINRSIESRYPCIPVPSISVWRCPEEEPRLPGDVDFEPGGPCTSASMPTSGPKRVNLVRDFDNASAIHFRPHELIFLDFVLRTSNGAISLWKANTNLEFKA